ncbi:TIGR03086 family metal-binding protein [Thermomonospora catenispora]|uniref:TIGR03086 family metal-binding protein n=1 Tax=Thermomonospora catenispora TaxID=2493090 RepID=UPI001124987D|nr:TIGR03086 family metal-binding protein [Thermomonospora catenispora]TNY38404.1 TIGR03086 family protein [Thermomonospora catenispora]
MSTGLSLLERAVGYALGGLRAVTPEALSRPTPCRGWSLRTLLAHMNDSLQALCEAADLGRVDLAPTADLAGDPVTALRERASRLLGAWTAAPARDDIAIAGLSLAAPLVAVAGALEITVHGWDVARACGADHPIPVSLAADLLPLASILVAEEDRPGRFAPPLPPPPDATAADRLLAFLGRAPS